MTLPLTFLPRRSFLIFRLAAGPGYLLTPKAARRLDEAAARVYRTGRGGWDGRFDMILLHEPVARRDAARLTYLGYGMLSEQVWVAPRPSEEVEAVLTRLGWVRDAPGPCECRAWFR